MKLLEKLCSRIYGSSWNPFYKSGALAVFLLCVALVTGVYLLLFYNIADPHGSVEALHQQTWGGRWIRSLHRYASDLAVLAVVVHIWKMWTTSRSWGRRARAWRSGWLLLAGVIFCGWTGLVLVWDTQSYLLATEATRALDALPIFSEPLGQLFARPQMNHSFFFAVLFLHVAVPLGLAGLYLIHVSTVARPTHQPPWALRRHVLLALVGLAVVWPAVPMAAADPTRITGEVALDLIYVAWLPLTRMLPGWAFWPLGLLLLVVVMAVPNLSRPVETPPPSWVDPNSCTGCTTCVQDCPYEAIAMVPRTGPTSEDGRHSELVALVDPDLCASCGICSGSCAPMGVGPDGRRGKEQLGAIRAWFEEHQPVNKLVLLGCGHNRSTLPDEVMYYPVSCTGSMHTSVVEYLLRRGVRGVFVLSCPPRDCHHREGPKWAYERLYHGREAELQERVDRRRLRFESYSAGEELLLRAALADFSTVLDRLSETEKEENPELELVCEEKVISD